MREIHIGEKVTTHFLNLPNTGSKETGTSLGNLQVGTTHQEGCSPGLRLIASKTRFGQIAWDRPTRIIQ